jgi:hypothetical protein
VQFQVRDPHKDAHLSAFALLRFPERGCGRQEALAEALLNRSSLRL